MQRSSLVVAVLATACGSKQPTPPTVVSPPPPAPTPAAVAPPEPAPTASSDKAPADAPRTNRWMDSKTPAELTWAPLDASAGAKGPQVALVWGDLKAGASGFFLKLPAGNPGTLHTHAADYHAIAIAGTATNLQDGQKAAAALPPQSYWSQLAGLAHTTSCKKGADCIVFVHATGAFDVTPAQPAKGAKPDPRYVEKRAKDLTWQPLAAADAKGPQIASLWGDAQTGPSGMLMRIPAGNASSWHIHRYDFHGVVLAGIVQNIESGREAKDLPVGSYWMQPGGNKHTTNCKAGGADCIVYAHFIGAYDHKPVP